MAQSSDSFVRIRDAFRSGQIGFDVEDGRAVHQICAGHMDKGPFFAYRFDPGDLHHGQAQGIGPVGRARREHADPGVAVHLRRTYRGAPGGIFRGFFVTVVAAFLLCRSESFGEVPDEPDMGIVLQPPQRVGIAVRRLEHDGPFQLGHEPGLPGNAELGG